MMAAHPSVRHHPSELPYSHRHDFDFRPSTSLTYDDAPSLPPPHTKQPSISSLPSLNGLPSSLFSSLSSFSSPAFSEGGDSAASHQWGSSPFASTFSSSSTLQSLPSPSSAGHRERDADASTHNFSSAPPSTSSSPSPYASPPPSQSSALPSSRLSAISPPLSHSFSQSHASHHPFLHSAPLTLPLSSASSPHDDLPKSWRPPIFDERSSGYDDADDLLKPRPLSSYPTPPRPIPDVLSPRSGRTQVLSNGATLAYGYGGVGEVFNGYAGVGSMGMGAVGGNIAYSGHSSRSMTPSLEGLDLDSQLQGLSMNGGGGLVKDGGMSQTYFSDRLADLRDAQLSQSSYSDVAAQQQHTVLQLQQLQQLVNSQLSRFDNLNMQQPLYGNSQLHSSLPGSGSSSGLHTPHGQHLNGVLVHVPQNSNLYVDQLPIPYSEHDLRQLFSPYGPIEKLRVATDPSTGEQMGYGFVMFQYAEDAQAAIAALHNRPLGHKTLHISLAKQKNGQSKRSSHPSTPISSFSPSSASLMHPSLSLSSSHSPPLIPPIPNTNVYMAGIPHHYSKVELDALTSPYGHILESRVLVDKATMTNRGIGFVRYERVDEAAAAILELNGRVAPGGTEVMVVKLAVEKGGEGGRRDSLRDGRGLTALQAMKAQRSQTGIDSLYRGGGMDSHRSVLNVDDPIISPRHVRHGSLQLGSAGLGAGFGRPPSPPQFHRASSDDSSSYSASVRGAGFAAQGGGAKGVDLFVFHLPVSVTEDELQQLFALYGPVLNVAVMRDRRTGEHKGFGFVTMQNVSDAENAVKYLTGYALGSKYLKVSFKTNKASNHY